MKKSMLAGAALLAGVVIALPMLSSSAADAPARVAEAGEGGHGDNPRPGFGHHEGGGWMGHHGGMHGMMHGMMNRSPQQRCEERLARRAGMIAYTVAKLDLKPEQKPLWDRLQSIAQAAGDKERQLCAALKPAGEGAGQTLLDRVNRREQFLTVRLQSLQQARPALEQFYQALTPEQKAIVDHPFRH